MAIDKDALRKTLDELRREEADAAAAKKADRDSLKKELRKEIIDELLKEDDPDSDEHEFEA